MYKKKKAISFIAIILLSSLAQAKIDLTLSDKKANLGEEIFLKISNEHFFKNQDRSKINVQIFYSLLEQLDSQKIYFTENEITYFMNEFQSSSNDIEIAASYELINLYFNRLIEATNYQIKVIKKIPIISDLIADYFDGDITAINGISVRQPGATFSQAAWKAMRKVKAGVVITYADLADRAGSTAAVRAAGTACAKNAIMLVVPCHRIVKSGGALGNYAYGVNKKEWLLSHEGAL